MKKAKYTKWCNVDINNEFTFMENKYRIDSKVEEYKVYKKAGEIKDYTNEAYMVDILAIDQDGVLYFYDQECKEIDSKLIHKI